MSKPEWGLKHNCHNCDKSFYDMHKAPAKCPVCGIAACTKIHTNHTSTLHIHANEDDIIIGKPRQSVTDYSETVLDLDFDDDIGVINEYFEDDLEDVLELPENVIQERI